MTKAELVAEISTKTGIEKTIALQTVEAAMKVIKNTMSEGENVYLRGFGSFIVKKRAQKLGRIISKNTTIIIPAHNIPAFKPAKTFANKVKNAKAKKKRGGCLMPGTKRTQLLVLIGALLLIAVLYFAPQQVKKKETAGSQNNDPVSFESILSSVKGSLKREEAEPVSKIESELSKHPDDISLLDSLGKQWDRLQQPVISSHYFEMIAHQQPGEKNWLNAAYRYFDAFRFAGDSVLRALMIHKAIASYDSVLSYNGDNLDAKTDLGVCYAEGTTEPMKGIMLLREVISKNPEHENAQFNLGVLSVKSGQYEKAIERFKKVLEINPARKEMYYLIGKSYSLSGNKEKALENLEKLKKETTDLQLIEQTNSLINQININH